MKIRTTNFFGSGGTTDVATYVKRELDGTDYDRGQLEALEATVNNLLTSFGMLLDVLADKRIISIKNVGDIVNKYDMLEEVEE